MDTNRPSGEVLICAVCAQELIIIIELPDVGVFQLAVLWAGDGLWSRHDDGFIIWDRVVCVKKCPCIITNLHLGASLADVDHQKPEFIPHLVQSGLLRCHYPWHLILQVVDAFQYRLAQDWYNFGIPPFYEPDVKCCLSTRGVILTIILLID